MLRAAIIGLLASGVVAVCLMLQSIGRGMPLITVGVFACIAAILQQFGERSWVDRRSLGEAYEGLADFFMDIHAPSIPEKGWKWLVRGSVSFLFVLAGGVVGVEGPAIEFTNALAVQLRSGSERWFEQRRRTDAGSVLAAAISAGFGAPFAGLIVPIEMGIGGNAFSAVISSVFAFLGISIFKIFFSSKGFGIDLGEALAGVSLNNWKEWMSVGIIGAACAVFGVILIWFFRYFQKGFNELSQGRGWVKMILGGLILVLIAASYQGSLLPPSALLQEFLLARRIPWEAALAFFARAFGLSVVLASFGTLGIFWPIFLLGGLLGYTFYDAGFYSISGFGAASGLIGAAGMWGSVLGAPIAVSVLIYELTQNVQIMVFCFSAAFFARLIVSRIPGFWSRGWVEVTLETRGLPLSEGRSVRVLESIRVRDAMVRDHDTVSVNDLVSELRPKVIRSRYPYLPVINSQGVYQGVLTFDRVLDAWETGAGAISSHTSLLRLLEVKDLLYRSGVSIPTVREDQSLSEVNHLLKKYPCLVVLDAQGEVSGLLLVPNVRQAYDREVIRKQMSSCRES